jgi:hypothetical protein
MESQAPTPPLSRKLIGLNIALLAVLAVVTLLSVVSSRAGAQPGATPPVRGRGEYTMVSGKVQGATTAAIYIVDAANQEVVALSWDRANNRVEPIGFRSLNDDARYLTKPR